MTSANDEWRTWFVPGVFAMTVLEIASERGLSTSELLAQAEIPAAPGEIIEAGLRFGQHLRLIDVVERALDDPALAVEMGWRLPPTALGSVGYAILSSANMGEALEMLQRFWHLMGQASSIAVDTRGETGFIELDVRLPVPGVDRAKVKELCFVAMHRGVMALVPQAAEETEAWFDFPEPSHAAVVRGRIGRVCYDMPACQFRFPTRLLDAPLAMGNPVGLRAAVGWCEREEKERGLADGRLTARLTSELKPGREGYPSLPQMAKRLGMAPRTLRRHLKQEGTRYSELLEAARRRESLRLLDNTTLAVREVAEMLGYDDPANFSRAFRRWTGRTPSQYRDATLGDG